MILLWLYIASAVVLWLPTARWIHDVLLEGDGEAFDRSMAALMALVAVWLWPAVAIAAIGARALRTDKRTKSKGGAR